MNNQTKNTATPTNQAFSSASITWEDADFAYEDATGTWQNPYVLTNQAKNTGSVTNQAKS